MKPTWRTTQTFIIRDETLRRVKERLVVWWYGPVIKNYQAGSVPKVVVFFRHLDEEGILGDFIRMNLALTHLGVLRIGSIWREGVCKSRIDYETRTFNVSLTEGGWKIVSPYEVVNEKRRLDLIKPEEYPLRYPHDQNFLLDFSLSGSRNLLIPCVEYFVRCYGRSAEVKRVLATYSWHEAATRLYKPIDEPVPPGTWPVILAERMYNDDVVFIAHVMYDPYANHRAKQVYSQAESAFKAKKSYAFLKIAPWFQGAARLSVAGIPINGGRTFLGLRILGGSEPEGNTIIRDREWTNKTDGTTAEDVGSEDACTVPVKVMHGLPDIIDLTSDDEPDHGSASVDVEEDEYVVLGKPRVVIDVRRAKEGGSSTRYCAVDEATSFSTGEPHGSSKGVGHASIHARPVMESHGVLRDMWDALLYLGKTRPAVIQTVEWFTFEDGIQNHPEPKLVALEPFDEKKEAEIAPDVMRWLYFDVARQLPRGILIARVTATGKHIYLFEIQRRPVMKKGANGVTKEDEETFKGLVFVLNDERDLAIWLRQILAAVRHVKGVVQRVTRECPGDVHAFKHRPARGEAVPCETAVKNALRKVGVFIPPPTPELSEPISSS